MKAIATRPQLSLYRTVSAPRWQHAQPVVLGHFLVGGVEIWFIKTSPALTPVLKLSRMMNWGSAVKKNRRRGGVP